MRRSHFACMYRNGGTVQITRTGVFSQQNYVDFFCAWPPSDSHCLASTAILSDLFLTCFKLDCRLKIGDIVYNLPIVSPCPEHRNVQFWWWERAFQRKVRKLFSRWECSKNCLTGEINNVTDDKVERICYCGMKAFYRAQCNISVPQHQWSNSPVQLILPPYPPSESLECMWSAAFVPFLRGLSLLGTINHTILLSPLICVHSQLVWVTCITTGEREENSSVGSGIWAARKCVLHYGWFPWDAAHCVTISN